MNPVGKQGELNRQDVKVAKRGGEGAGTRSEPEGEVDDLARRVIGAAIEVHRHLGPGFLGRVCEEALAIEFQIRDIIHQRQFPIGVSCKGAMIGEGHLDFLVGGRLIVVLKAVEGLAAIYKSQVMSYFKATRLQLALLINFNVLVLKHGVPRVILSRIPPPF